MIKLRLKILILLITVSLSGLLAQTKQDAIKVFATNSGLKHAAIGFSVKDFRGNKVVAHNGDKSMTPASTLKIVTTATALELLESDFRFETKLYKEGNILTVLGSGDPTLGTRHFDNIQDAFLEQWADKIVTVFGNQTIDEIRIVDDLFGYEGVSSRWIRQDMGNYYAAGAYGISVFDNAYELFFNTVNKNAAPRIVKTQPVMKNLAFTNTLTLNTTGRDNGYIMGEPFSNHRLLAGNIPAGKTSFSIKGDIPDPGMYLGEQLKEVLQKRNMKVGKVTTMRNTYEQFRFSTPRLRNWGTEFYVHRSFPLRDIVQNINFRSNNHFTEHLIRLIGRIEKPDIYSSALDKGVEKIEKFWKDKGLNIDALFMYDGCGLAPSNAISADLLCDILIYMQTKSKNSDVFLKSLPQAGKEGTVRSLLKGTSLVGKVYAKSGSIVNVRCYAGYYINGDKKYAYSLMVNNHDMTSFELQKAIEKLLIGVF